MSVAKCAFMACLVVAPAIAHAQSTPTYRVLGADRGHVAIVDSSGRVTWEVPDQAEVHDLALLPNGNILCHDRRRT